MAALAATGVAHASAARSCHRFCRGCLRLCGAFRVRRARTTHLLHVADSRARANAAALALALAHFGVVIGRGTRD